MCQIFSRVLMYAHSHTRPCSVTKEGRLKSLCFSVFLSLSMAANMEEASKLIGHGRKHLVMGRVVEAVASLQEASSML